MKLLKWLSPGMFVKRWLFVAVLGLLLFGLGIAEIPRPISFLSIFSGIFFIYIGIKKWSHSIISALLPQGEGKLVEILYRRRQHGKGLRIVAIGGGSGLSSLLRGLKEISSNVAAVVTVSDDGGSSGVLRRELGVLPPGDIRNCLVALADTEPLLCDLFQYRFSEKGGLEGHSFGNLYLAAMTNVTGDFLSAVKESSKVLAIKGSVLPATLDSVVLCAELSDGTIVEGESNVGRSHLPINRLFFKPSSPKALDEVCAAIKGADAIVLGPGSLYTSVIPNILVSGVLEAIKISSAVKIYICNIMTQPGETDFHMASEYLGVLEQYLGPGILNYMIVNDGVPEEALLGRYREDGARQVEFDIEEIEKRGVKPVIGQFVSGKELIRHDSIKLALTIQDLLMRKTIYKAAPRGTFSPMHAAGRH